MFAFYGRPSVHQSHTVDIETLVQNHIGCQLSNSHFWIRIPVLTLGMPAAFPLY